MDRRGGYGFSWRIFLTYNTLIVAAMSLVVAVGGDLSTLPVRAAIFALVSLTISGLMEAGVPLVDRLTQGSSARRQLVWLNVLYLVGGAAGFTAAFGLAHLIFGVRMTSRSVVTLQSIVGAGLITVFIGNMIFTYEGLRSRVRKGEAALSRQALERERLEKLRAEAELAALQARINPHFLFNTLNSLAALIPVDAAAAEEMTQRLSECFRHALRASHGPVTLGEEIAFVEDYLALEKLRFGDRLRVELHVDPRAHALDVPGLVVQPLVENALKHGLAPLEQGGTVRLDVALAERELRVRVEDDGCGLAVVRPEGGTGLANVRERLRSGFGEGASLELVGAPGRGAVATVRIRLRDAEPAAQAPDTTGTAAHA